MFTKEKITKEVFIDGMNCIHCAIKVKNALIKLSGVSDAKVEFESKKAVLKLKKDIENSVLKAIVEKLGYKVTEIK